MSNTSTYAPGKDFRNNLNVINDRDGEYATNLFTNEAVRIIKSHDKQSPLFLMINHLAPHAGNDDAPMQARPEDILRFSYIPDEKRRLLAGKY
jgi:arylsulfatase B